MYKAGHIQWVDQKNIHSKEKDVYFGLGYEVVSSGEKVNSFSVISRIVILS